MEKNCINEYGIPIINLHDQERRQILLGILALSTHCYDIKIDRRVLGFCHIYLKSSYRRSP